MGKAGTEVGLSVDEGETGPEGGAATSVHSALAAPSCLAVGTGSGEEETAHAAADAAEVPQP